MKENDELINGNRESGIDLYPREDESENYQIEIECFMESSVESQSSCV